MFSSSQAALPSRTPTSTLPFLDVADTLPRTTSPIRTSPLELEAVMSDSARSTDSGQPLEALTFAGPVTTPIWIVPLPVETLAVPSTVPIRMSPDPLCHLGGAARPVDGDLPTPVRMFSGSASPIRTAPKPVFRATAPSTPSVR